MDTISSSDPDKGRLSARQHCAANQFSRLTSYLGKPCRHGWRSVDGSSEKLGARRHQNGRAALRSPCAVLYRRCDPRWCAAVWCWHREQHFGDRTRSAPVIKMPRKPREPIIGSWKPAVDDDSDVDDEAAVTTDHLPGELVRKGFKVRPYPGRSWGQLLKLPLQHSPWPYVDEEIQKIESHLPRP